MEFIDWEDAGIYCAYLLILFVLYIIDLVHTA